MTGQLAINLTGGNRNTVGLNVFNTISGSMVHGQYGLTSSGILAVESGASIYGALTVYNGKDITLRAEPGVTSTDPGDIVFETNWGGQKGRIWTEPNAGSGLYLSSTDITPDLTISALGFVGIGTTNPDSTLEIIGTASGRVLRAQNTLASSGSLTWEGAASGATLVVSGQFSGAGLTDCDAATQTLAWDAATGRFSCGTDSDTTYTAGRGLGLNGTSFSLNSTITGSLVRFNTVSGSTIYAKTSLASSGTLVWEGAASGSTLYVASSIAGAGLTDCDAASSRLLWDETTGRFSCSTIAGAADVIAVGDSRYVRIAGATMTGSLIIRSTSGTNALGLTVAGTMSGVGLNISGTGSQPLIRTNSQYGMVLMGTGGVRMGTGLIMPQLFVAGREPRLVSQITPTAAADNLALQGRYLYVTSTNLQAIDVSSAAKPAVISAATTSTTNPSSIAIQGKTAFMVVSTVVQAFDISNPASMIALSTFTPTSSPGAIAAQGRYIYTLNTTAQRLQVIDANDPKRMVSVSSSAVTGSTPNAIAVQGRYAYITNGGGGTMQIFDLQNLSAPVSLGTTSAGTTPNGIAVQGRYAYVINTTGMQIFDISNPSSVVTLGSVSGSAQGAIAVQGRYAYVVGANGFQTIDISDPKNPSIASTITTGTALTDIVVQGRYAYVANNGGTRVNIYDLGGTYTQQAEVGSLEVSALSVRQSLQGLDASFNGNMAIGASLMVSGNSSFGTGGLITIGGSNLFSINIRGTASGNVIHAEKLIASSGSILANGIIASRGALSGASLNIMNGNSYILGNTMIGSAATADTKLEVVGTISGSALRIAQSIASSGSLTWEGAASGASLYLGGSLQGAGLTDCDLSTNVLRWDITTGRFSCGTIAAGSTEVGTAAFSGAILRLADSRYVNTSGDTMTGALVLNWNGTYTGGTLLNVRGGMSGKYVFANTELRSSGSLTVRGATTLNGAVLLGDSASDVLTVGGIFSSGGSIRFRSTISGTYLKVDRDISASGALSVRGAATFKGAMFLGDAASDIITVGGIFSSGGSVRFRSTISGTYLKVDRDISASGGLAIRGTTTLNGTVNLGDMSTDTINVAGTFYSGSYIRFRSTISGSSLRIDRNISASGSLSLEGGLTGATIAGFGLTDCGTGTQKLLWNAATGKFLCGTDLGASGTSSFTGAVLAIGNGRFVKKQGDTMTGALVLNWNGTYTGGTLLNVRGGMSGKYVFANTELRSSGSLTVRGTSNLNGNVLLGDSSTDTISIGGILQSSGGVLGTIRVRSTLSGTYLTLSRDLSASGALTVRGTSNLNGNVLLGDSSTDTISIGGILSSSGGVQGTIRFRGTISGTYLKVDRDISASGSLFVQGNTTLGDRSTDTINIAGTFFSGSYIRFRSTISGSSLKVDRNISASGSLTWEGAASGATLVVSGQFSGAGLTDCDLSTQKLTWDASTNRFGCAALSSAPEVGLATFSGAVIRIGDTRYVRKAGDTMTGSLVINLTSGFVGLNVKQTISGSSIYASTSLASSGTLVVENTIARGSGALTVIQQAEFATGAYIYSSGTVLALDSYSFNGANRHILFGYLGNFDTNLYRSAISTLKTNGSFFATNVISGSVLRGNTLASSGSLVWEGAASGATLVVSGQFSGAGLTDCDLSTQKLTWDSSTNRFGCATLNVAPEVGLASFSGAVIRIGDTRYVRKAGDTMTGALVINLTSGFVGLNVKQTISGSTIYASTSLASSGTLVVESSAVRGSGALTVMQNAEFGTGVYINASGAAILALDALGKGNATPHIIFGYAGNFDTNLYRSVVSTLKTNGSFFATNVISGSVLRGNTLASSGSLTWEGAASGATLVVSGQLSGAGLTDCDLSTQKLTWDSSTNRFGCATLNVAPEVGLASFSGAVIRIGDTRYVRKAGDTMTGSLVINLTSGFVGLNVKQTMSGSKIYASTSLASSGTLVIESLTRAGSGSLSIIAAEFQSGAYVNGSGAGLMVLDATGRTNTTKHILFGYKGNFDTNLYRSATGTLKTDGAFSIASTLTLTGSVKAFNVTGTLGANAMADGAAIQIVSNGSSSNPNIIQRAAIVSLTAGYTGSGRTVGLEMVTAAGGTSRDFYGLTGNYGFAGSALGVTSGANVAAFGNAHNGGINIGFFARTTTPTTSNSRGVNVGMVGLSKNIAANGVEVGGYFGLNDSNPVFESGAIVIDNGVSGSPIILGRDNGKIVFSIQDGGNMRLGSGAGITARQNIYTSNSFNNEAVIINTDETTASQNIFRIISDVAGTNDNAFRIRADGSTFSDNAYSAAGADYAEWFYSTDNLEKGEVVCIDVTRNNAVTRCTSDADSNVMGIVSTNPAFIGNTIGGADGIIPPGYALIGLIGQVPAKVKIENNEAIRPGDSLTAGTIPGYARRARAGESTVGVALEGLESGEGVINVLISRRNQSLTVESVEENVLKTIAAMEIEDEVQIMVASTLEDLNVDSQITTEVERQLAGMQSQNLAIEAIRSELNALKAELAHIKAQSGSTTIITQTGSYSHSSSLELEGTLTTGGDARIGGDLHIDGTLNASSLFVPNGLSIDGGVVMRGLLDAMELRVASGAVIDGVMTINGALVLGSGAYIEGGSGTLSIGDLIVQNSLFVMGDVTIEGLATFLGDVEVKGELIVSNKQAGFAMIPASGTSVTIYFGSGMKATPVVTATPNGPVFSPWWVSAPTQTGFTIHVASAVTQDTLFSWISLSTAAPMTITAQVMDNGSLVFPTDDRGVPVSSNMVWNACIRNVTLLDSEGQPLSCGRYHDQFTWSHPDLGMSFIWNTTITPPLLKLPEGYNAEVTESAQSIEDAFNNMEDIEEPEIVSSSSASSEASVSSDSSVSSSSDSSTSSQPVDTVTESSASSTTEESSSSAASSVEPEPMGPEVIPAE